VASAPAGRPSYRIEANQRWGKYPAGVVRRKQRFPINWVPPDDPVQYVPSRTGGKQEPGGDVQLHRQMIQSDRCRQEFCGVNSLRDRWFEYACRLRGARIINSHCQIDAPKDAVKRALSKTILMFATSLSSQRTNDDSSPSNSADRMPLLSLMASSYGVYFSTISTLR
jgi:hypothetical protein